MWKASACGDLTHDKGHTPAVIKQTQRIRRRHWHRPVDEVTLGGVGAHSDAEVTHGLSVSHLAA